MTVTGTLDYMAPEVLNREPAGRAADVWPCWNRSRTVSLARRAAARCRASRPCA